MKPRSTRLSALAVIATGLVSAPAGFAANGMNAPGNGAIQMSLAGAGTALVEDSFAALRNPAAAAWMGDGAALDLGIVVPRGGARVEPLGARSAIGLFDIQPGKYQSVEGVFPVPAYARNWRLSDRQALGWGLTASGLKSSAAGGSASLSRGVPTFSASCEGGFGGGQPVDANPDLRGLCGRSGKKLGVDLTQLLLSAFYAYRVDASLSLGIEPVFAAQRVQLRGLGAFAAFSNQPQNTTDNDFDYSWGGGVRLGLLWEPADGLAFGAAYQSRLTQSEFARYQGAIVGGSLDFAPTLNLGAQIHFLPGQRLIFDLEQIGFADVTPLAKQVEPQRFSDECFVPRILARSPNPAPLSACLGGKTGPGFGWRDVTVYKIGYQSRLGNRTLRAGFSWGGNPVNSGQVLSRFFAPPISDKHAAIGYAWKRPNGARIHLALTHAINHSIREKNVFSNAQLSLLQGTLVGIRVVPDAQDQVVESSLRVWQLHVTYAWAP